METEALRVLLIEDNPADVHLLREAFRENGFAGDITVADDGGKALEFLRGSGDEAEARLDLIILDLNLPKIGGLSVLAEIKKEIKLSPVLVIVLSTSRAANDCDAARKLGADRYLSKAVDYSGTLALARQIENFWRASIRHD